MPTKQSLIDAIADALAVQQKDYMIGDACDSLNLEPTDYNPSISKRVYVRKRLRNKDISELLKIADKVLMDYGDTNERILEKEVQLHRGQFGNVEQIIFASNQKPDITFDLINHKLNIINANGSLIFDRQILQSEGLYLQDLLDWWQPIGNGSSLYNRMLSSIQSDPEELFYATYYRHFRPLLGDKLPALLPQVHFNYDPKTIKQLGGQRRITQRMDFLMFLPNKRAIFEIDGIHHYSVVGNGGKPTPNPQEYAKMVSEDRMYRLAGYDVFRFGGYEFIDNQIAEKMIIDFFNDYFSGNKIH
ncbi:hypothetical protein PAESOLCIP111_01313 [Paenibacillus solanacearum]|uniref:AbiJ-NTD3 domain-containing protein n=1 Tax=Paenibacillus solanacearum TaxID=2048548 RepID=A0A916JWT1_9BACL|nr:hypothetical protein [Paenibacillus solanacearum]CAG7610961.1 hypothetical protein PAESOLCIP111_01313 [Paenibacillus solanacearum]